MRNNVGSQFSSSVRTIQGQAKVALDHPVWSEFPAPETTPRSYAHFANDTQTYRGFMDSIRQYGLVSGNATIYMAEFQVSRSYSQIDRPFNAWISMPAPGVSTMGEEYRAIAASGSDALYAAIDGKVYKLSNVSSWTLLADLTDQNTYTVPKISLAAIDEYNVVAAAVYASDNVYDNAKLSVISSSGAVDTWKGFLPKCSAKLGLAAIRTDDNTIYIYVDDWSGKKPVSIKRYTTGIWGATKEILPMDALDDESSFSVGFASKVGDRYFLTGTLKRKYGPAYSIYMLGPEKFTFGRDLIIQTNLQKPLQLWGNWDAVWAIGIGQFFVTDYGRGIFTDNVVLNDMDLHGYNLNLVVNQADRVTLDVPGSEVRALGDNLIPGARIDLSVTANSDSYTVGRYGVDRIRKQENESGDFYQVDCTSYAMKKLLDWESDTYFDYMGQGEVHGDPGDLTKLVRFSGGKYTQPTGGGLQLESFNDDGMLYTTPSASHGGFIHTKFTNVQTTATFCGVGLNYGEETMAEAAVRLNKKVEQVTAAERGRWCLFAIYIPEIYMGVAGKGAICLFDYNTIRVGNLESPTVLNPWRQISMVYIDRPAAGGTMHLAMQYQDGYTRVYYRNFDTSDLSLVISTTAIFSKEIMKAEHDNYGRGAIYLRNNTGYHMSYSFMSDSDVIPLYDTAAKYDKTGFPIADRTDKFPTTNGTVQVDSERIFYTGLAGWQNDGYGQDRRSLADLDWVPGKILCQAGDGVNTPAGTDTDFARSRGSGSPHVHGNNYLLQVIPSTAYGNYVNAVRIWLKKINYPEDGVTVTINQGNVGSSAAAVALVNNSIGYGTMAPGSSISASGGWVTFYFDNINIAVGGEYWIMIRRNKNANHPSSTSYFQYKKMADSTLANAGCYVFCEEDDQAVGQSGDMAFVLYGRVEGLNKEACIMAKYVANVGLPTADAAQTFFNGCAVTITDGAGKNNCYRVVRSYRWTSSPNDLYLFFVDKDPGKLFDIGTKLRVVPAFYGLKRGQNGYDNKATSAAAHGDKSLVHIPTNTFAKALLFEYYTADEDLTLAEVAESIARKAGVVETDLSNRHSGNVPGHQLYGAPYTLETVPAQSKNAIVSLNLPYMGGDQDVAAVLFRDATDLPVYAVQFVIGLSNNVRFGFAEFLAYQKIYNGGTGKYEADPYSMLKVPFDENVQGDFRVSLYDGHLAAWVGGRLLAGINIANGLQFIKDVLGMTITTREWTKIAVDMQMQTPAGASAKVLIPQAGTRVDNFVMDMGKTGAQLLTSLVGEKRIFYRDDGEGRLRIYTDREIIPGAYSRATATMSELTDIGVATRVLLEGGEVVEVVSSELTDYGNFFKTFNISEINNLDDANYFAGLILDDMSLNRERIEIEGAVDLRVEPTDKITVSLKGGGGTTALRDVIVDAVAHNLRIDETDATYDMRLSGRLA